MQQRTTAPPKIPDFTAARRQASRRCEPLPCRHQDPLDHLGVADDDVAAWLATRSHLKALGLLRPEVEARIHRGLRGAA